MDNGFFIFCLCFGMAFTAIVEQQGPEIPDNCGPCIPEECVKPRSCVAGIVMDRCVLTS